ncbi:MAG: radical SAM protein [Elusimicrobiota bacterium]|nr:radical SAM protein [Elusimicrobiota bacterium]
MIKPDHLVIYLSGRCNLACPYCYASGVSKKTILRAALLAALDAFAAARPEEPKFTILGGEPLLCRDLVYAALDRIRELFGPGAPVHLFTNGLLLKKGEAARLLKRGVDLTVSLNSPSGGAEAAVKNIPLPLRGKIRAGVVATPAGAGGLVADILCLLKLGFGRLAWSPDITAAWDGAALARLRASSKALLLEYLGRLRSGRGLWELANGYEAIAAASGGIRPGPCRNMTLAPDGFFYPCDKMLSGPAAMIRPFRAGADGSGREKFFRLAAKSGVSSSQSMCPAAPWAAARFSRKGGPVPAGQAAAGKIAALWLKAAARAGLSSPVFKRLHGR